MKKYVAAMCTVYFIFGLIGCASTHSDIARKNIAEAENTIQIARLLGISSETSADYAQAIADYGVASGGSESEEKSSEYALRANQKAEFAIHYQRQEELQARQRFEQALQKNNAEIPKQINTLQGDLKNVESDIAALHKAFSDFKQTYQAEFARREETNSAPVSETALTAPIVADPEVIEIQFKFLSGRKEHVIFLLNSAIRPKTFFIKGNQPRMVCDFYGVRPGAKVPRRINVDGDFIKQIRTWHHTGSNAKLRVVLDLAYPFNFQVQQTFLQNQNTFLVTLQPK